MELLVCPPWPLHKSLKYTLTSGIMDFDPMFACYVFLCFLQAGKHQTVDLVRTFTSAACCMTRRRWRICAALDPHQFRGKQEAYI